MCVKVVRYSFFGPYLAFSVVFCHPFIDLIDVKITPAFGKGLEYGGPIREGGS